MDWKSLLHQNISHSCDISVTVIWGMSCYVSTCNGVIRRSSGTKPNSGVTRPTTVLIVSYLTNSCFRKITYGTYSIEALLVTVQLQRARRTNQLLPLVTTQGSSAVCPISNQWVQRVGLLVNDNKPELSTNLELRGFYLSLNVNNTMHHQRKNPHEISNTVRVKAINLYPTCRSLQAF